MITYGQIAYVGSDKKLICRDGNSQYAASMDLRYYTYDKLPTMIIGDEIKFVIIDISVGWTTLEDMDFIEDFIKSNNPRNIKFRLVDQYQHQWYKDGSSNVYIQMAKLSIDYGIEIIGTYDVDYYGLKVGLVLPYPYLEEDEMRIDHSIREHSVILTGADIESIYPLRHKLYNLSCRDIVKLNHPGYSGKHWSSGLVGDEYMKYLSKFSFMACTTCNEGYELLKYIECAEAGCIPIGEVPPSLAGTEAEKWIIKIPGIATLSSEKFSKWFTDLRKSIDYSEYSREYRSAIKKLRNKKLLKVELLKYLSNGCSK